MGIICEYVSNCKPFSRSCNISKSRSYHLKYLIKEVTYCWIEMLKRSIFFLLILADFSNETLYCDYGTVYRMLVSNSFHSQKSSFRSSFKTNNLFRYFYRIGFQSSEIETSLRIKSIKIKSYQHTEHTWRWYW